MIGVAPVLLGIGTFQTTFSVGLHLTGRFFSLLRPFRLGPRHCGQFSARAGRQSRVSNTSVDFGVGTYTSSTRICRRISWAGGAARSVQMVSLYAGDGAFGGAGDQGAILGDHAGLVAWSAGSPGSEPLGE